MKPAITLKQLRYLVALADTKHFGRAAAHCHVSQPSLSTQIQQLEECLGVQLFERSRRRVLSTQTGEALVEKARRVLAELDVLVETAQASGKPLAGEFRLGVIPTLGPYFLPHVTAALRKAFPDLRLYLREDLTDRLLDWLERGRLEAALLAVPVERSRIVGAELFDEPFLLATPNGHALSQRCTVDYGDIGGETLLLLEDGHCLRDQALEVCRATEHRHDDVFAATSLETLRAMVAGGLGVTLLPALAAAASGTETGVALTRFSDPQPFRRIGLVWRESSARAGDANLLADFLTTHLPHGVNPRLSA